MKMTINIKSTNLTINVKDIEKSILFYLSIGFTLNERWGNHYAQLSAPGMIIGLHPTDEANLKDNSGNLSIGFTTDDFDQQVSHLNQLEIPFNKRKEEGGEFIHFSDPDGTSLYFIRPKW